MPARRPPTPTRRPANRDAILTVKNAVASLWQSAVADTIAAPPAAPLAAALTAAPAGDSPDMTHPILRAASLQAAALDRGPTPPQVAGVADLIGDCADFAWSLACAKLTGNRRAARSYEELLGPTGQCDPLWATCVATFLDYYRLRGGQIPYVRYQDIGHFVFDDLPDRATIALFADWGTGLPVARHILTMIAAHNPHVAIHLGDIYYSGTSRENHRNFLRLCRRHLPASTRVFTLSGNHDMYSGGVGYYDLIGALSQPASYFCLRNAHWQFIALDTGLHDHDPFTVNSGVTELDEHELAWCIDKLAAAAGRRSVLLSHHPYFSAFSPIGGNAVNAKLEAQLAAALPPETIWFWGHEHLLAIYDSYLNVRGRCIGHGAIPVSVEERPYRIECPEVPIVATPLGHDDVAYYNGYAIMTLDGPRAVVAYYSDSGATTPDYHEVFDAGR